jgi:hypothetical protein
MVGRRPRSCLANGSHNAGSETIGTREWAVEDVSVAPAADARRDASVAHIVPCFASFFLFFFGSAFVFRNNYTWSKTRVWVGPYTK